MGKKITIKQNNFSHGMQGDIRNKNLTSQAQVLGASKLKHFDIYSNTELKPIPALERYNTDGEKDFKIGVVSNTGETLYGLGVAIDNWYSTQWQYRAEVTGLISSQLDYVLIDLSNMPVSFWANVETDGSDIRVTKTSDKNAIKRNLISFDTGTQTGWLMVKEQSVNDFYIYYGNNEATTPTLVSSYEPKHLYTFDNDNGFDSGILGGSGAEFPLLGTITTDTSILGLGLTSNNQTDLGGGTAAFEPRSVSFLYKKTSNPASITRLVDHGRSGVSILPTGVIQAYVDTEDAAPFTVESITALSDDTWYSIGYSYRESDTTLFVYINGVLEASLTRGDVNNRIETTPTEIIVKPINGVIDMISEVTRTKSTSEFLAEHNQVFNNSTVYSIGAEEDFVSITPTYSGSQIYTKSLSGSWYELEISGILAQVDKDPLYSFVQEDSGIFSFLAQETPAGLTNVYGVRFSGVSSPSETLIGSLQQKEANPIKVYAADKRDFISISDELDSFDGSTYVDGVFLAGTDIASQTNYGYNLAIAGNRRNERGSIEIWDLLNDDPTTVIDTGTGKQRIIANVKGNLLTVTDNYISNDYKSYSNPSMEIKQWQGRDNYSTVQSFKYDNYNPTFLDTRNDIINNNRTDLNNFSIFHAEPSLLDMGMWSLGVNEVNSQFGVSIRLDTSTLGRIVQHNAIGNNIVLINEDFEHYYINLTDSYSQTSTFESMVIDAGFPYVQKDFNNIEITLDKPLPEGQEIIAYYRKENEDTYTKIFEFNNAGEKTWLANQDFTDTAFDSFNELQIKFESTGGDASIVEWKVEVEYEEEE